MKRERSRPPRIGVARDCRSASEDERRCCLTAKQMARSMAKDRGESVGDLQAVISLSPSLLPKPPFAESSVAEASRPSASHLTGWFAVLE